MSAASLLRVPSLGLPSAPGISLSSLSRFSTFAGLALLWLCAIRALHVEWTVNAQYSYGWVVPILCGYLAWTKWQSRPAASSGVRWPVLWSGVFLLAHLPARLVLEANPEWRVMSWFFALEAVAITLGLLALAGGWSWVRHMAFPVCCFLVAVPWPTPLEQPLQQVLMRLDAACAVEVLRWAGVPALQQGNLIELGVGLVGVDEACSGMRSLQTTLMLAVFLGELQRLNGRRRLFLVGAGLAVAFITNLLRALAMALLAGTHGLSAVERWHDAAGYTVLVVSIAVVWLISRGPGSASREVSSEERRAGRRIPWQAGLCVAGVLLPSEVATELWYLRHEKSMAASTPWSVHWPVGAAGFREAPISETARAALCYSSGRSALWAPYPGTLWQMVYLQWDPGRTSAQRASKHQPEICLPASGRVLSADLGTREIVSGGLTLPFRAYEFSDRGGPLHVYHCLWQDRAEGRPVDGDSMADRIAAAWAGRRNTGQRSLEIAIWGSASAMEAESALKQFLHDRIQMDGAL